MSPRESLFYAAFPATAGLLTPDGKTPSGVRRKTSMLTDTALRNLKPKSKTYKASDRDGMYVTVSTTGTVTFRYDYRLNGRRETLTIGRYGPAGISLALARCARANLSRLPGTRPISRAQPGRSRSSARAEAARRRLYQQGAAPDQQGRCQARQGGRQEKLLPPISLRHRAVDRGGSQRPECAT